LILEFRKDSQIKSLSINLILPIFISERGASSFSEDQKSMHQIFRTTGFPIDLPSWDQAEMLWKQRHEEDEKMRR